METKTSIKVKVSRLIKKGFKHREVADLLDIPITHVCNHLRVTPPEFYRKATNTYKYKGFTGVMRVSGCWVVEGYEDGLALATIKALENAIDTFIKRGGKVNIKIDVDTLTGIKVMQRHPAVYSNKNHWQDAD